MTPWASFCLTSVGSGRKAGCETHAPSVYPNPPLPIGRRQRIADRVLRGGGKSSGKPELFFSKKNGAESIGPVSDIFALLYHTQPRISRLRGRPCCGIARQVYLPASA
jgi:hypothetical protein